MTSFADPGYASGGGDATRTATVNLQANVSGYSGPVGQATAQTSGLARGVDEVQSKMHSLSKWAGRKLFQFSAADFAVLSGAAADSAVFQKQLGTLNATAAVTGTSMHGIKGGIESAFGTFPIARGQVVALAETITNLSVTAPNQIASLEKTFIKLSAATGESMTGLASGQIQLSRAMGVTDATQVGNYANSLLTVSKNAGVSASSVLEFGQTIAPFAKQAGIGEAAVQGIATSFVRVGADGFVATNALNTILSDINTSIATGGPGLLKYSNLLGMTTGQFAKMDKTKGVVDIFKALTKLGPQATQILDSLGLPGIRSQAAIAAVLQGGNLEQNIATAQGAQGNQKNLTKGAGAAMNNLADNLTKVRNQFTQFGTEIGTTFLAPMSAVAAVTASVGRHLNSLIAPLAPIMAGLGVVAGGMAGAGGIAVNLAGMIGAYALIKTLQRSTPVTRFKEGFTSGRIQEGGGLPREQVQAMPWRQRMGYYLGTGAAGVVGPRDPVDQTGPMVGRGSWQTWRNMGLAGITRVPGMLVGQTQRFLDESRLSAQERLTHDFGAGRIPLRESMANFRRDVTGLTPTQVVQQEVPRLMRLEGANIGSQVSVAGQMAAQAARKGWELIGARSAIGLGAGLLTGIPIAPARMANAFADRAATPAPAAAAAAASSASFVRAMGYMTKEPALALHILGQTAKTTAAELLKMNVATGRYSAAQIANLGARGLAGVASLGATGVGLAWRGAGQLLRGATSLPGMAAIMGSVELDKLWRKGQAGGKTDEYLNPIQRYNDLLGTTTANLANFNNQLLSGATKIAATPLNQAEPVSAGDASAASNKPTNAVWTQARSSKDRVAVGEAVLGSMQISDPKQRDAIKMDMFAAGYTAPEVQQMFSGYEKGGRNTASGLGKNLDSYLKTQGTAALGKEGQGVNIGGLLQTTGQDLLGILSLGLGKGGHLTNRWHANSSRAANTFLENAMTAIQARQITDTTQYNGTYAQQHALQGYLTEFAPEMQHAGANSQRGGAIRDELAHRISTITGGGFGRYLQSMTDNAHGVNLTENMTPEEANQQLIKVFQSSKEGRKWLKPLTDSGGTVDPKQFGTVLRNLQNTTDGSDFNTILRKSGPLGIFAANSGIVQQAIGTGSAGFVDPQRSADALQRQALLGTKSELASGKANSSQAIADIQTMLTKVTPGTPLFNQLSQAQQQIQVAQQEQAPYQSRGQAFQMAGQNYAAAQAGYDKSMAAGTATTGQHDFLLQQRATFEQSKASANEYFKSTFLAAQQFQLSMTRGEEDYQLSRQHSIRDFGIQIANAEFDNNKMRARATEDFNLQRFRSQQDYDTALKNQAASTAQAIYDPFARVNAKYTADAGTVLQNLQDENKRIEQQLAQTRALHEKGLSTQAIQTLDLANPTNAQEVNNLSSSMTGAQARQINAQVTQRGTATTALTQNPFQLAYVQGQKAFALELSRSQADFDKQLSRTQDDFQVQIDRARKAQDLSLSDMAVSYGNTVRRAKQDMTIAMTELSGSFAGNYTKAMAAIANSVAKYSPAAAKVMRQQMLAFAKEFPGLDILGPSAPKAPPRAAPHPSTPYIPGTSIPWPKAPAAPLAPAAGHRTSAPHMTAMGAIFRARPEGHNVQLAEAGHDEGVIPLNDHGQQFMAGTIVKALSQIMQVVGTGGGGDSTTQYDNRTFYSGPVSVEAADPEEMARKLADKAKLQRLSSPVRH